MTANLTGGPLKRATLLLAASIFLACADTASPAPEADIEALSNDAVRLLQEYVRVDTINPPGNETRGVAFLAKILDAAGMKDKLPLIYANDGVSLIPIAGDSSGEKIVNPHTFISTTAAIQQIYSIARTLGEMDPDNAKFFRDNARQYALDIRKLRAEFDAKVTGTDLSTFLAATMHSGYDYILQELGLQITAVIEPRHGVEPTARQLADTIDRINVAHVNVLFAEKYFASKLSDTIRDSTGVRMYSISHISSGPYTPEKFVDEMRENLDTLAQAINDVAASQQ